MIEQQETRPWVLITGPSSGIGEVFARRFAREGWNLVLVSRSKRKLEALARELRDGCGAKSLVLPTDLTLKESPQKVYRNVADAGIELEALVNNAGFGMAGAFFEAPLEGYLSMIDLNVRSLVELTGLFLPEMVARKRGLVLNVASTASFQPLPWSSIYAASKAFVTSFTEALWLETKDTGVRVLNLCPGLTKTPFGIVAGHHDFQKNPFAETPEAVVDTAFRALRNNKPTVVSGMKNRVLLALERLMPHRLLLTAVQIYQKSKRGL